VFDADRHAKKELKKQLRGIRPIERAVEGQADLEAELVRGPSRRGAAEVIPDEDRAPLAASGLKLKGRLEKVDRSLNRLAQKGGARSRHGSDGSHN
jgi:hypothetical protein